jgi:glycosyltransferase involved in cell wall biosynthesis
LNKLLASLVKQEFPKDQYEIIVADNRSTDTSKDIAQEYGRNYPHLFKNVSEDNIQSSYAARNRGIQIARGEILAFTDSDCIPSESWLREGCNALLKDNASMIAGRIDFIFRNSEPNIWEYFDAAGKLNQKSYVEGAGFGATANLFVRKDMFTKYGMFLSKLESGGDYEFGRRLTQAGEPLQYSEKALVFHPARYRFRSKLAKSKRIAKGQKMLATMGLLDHGQLNWRQLLLTLYYPTLPELRIRIYKKILLVLINNSFRYYNFYLRL